MPCEDCPIRAVKSKTMVKLNIVDVFILIGIKSTKVDIKPTRQTPFHKINQSDLSYI